MLDQQLEISAPVQNSNTVSTAASEIKYVTSLSELDNEVDSTELVVASISKENCAACLSLTRALANLQNQGLFHSVKLVKTSVENLGIDSVRKLGISQAPSMIFYKGGDEVYRINGFQGEEKVRTVLFDHLLA